MKTLAQAVAEVRNLILERQGNDGLVTDDELRTIVRLANVIVWKQAAKKAPALFEETQPIEVAVPVGGVLLYSAIVVPPGEVHKVHYVERLSGGAWEPVFPLTDRGDRYVTEPAVGGELRWMVRGLGLRFTPEPRAPIQARVSVTLVPSDPADADPLLAGRCGVHHDAVIFKAAMLAYSKDEEQATPYDDEYAEAVALLLRDLSEEQGMQTRRIRAGGPFA